jgi:hypothetical protein
LVQKNINIGKLFKNNIKKRSIKALKIFKKS